MCEQLNVAAFLWNSWAPRCLLSLCISNSTGAATERCRGGSDTVSVIHIHNKFTIQKQRQDEKDMLEAI